MIRRMFLAATTLAALTGSAVAQTDYPAADHDDRAVRRRRSHRHGGRLIAEPMTRTLGQQVIVENVAGAGGTLAAGREAKADPDGYTLLRAPYRPRQQRRALSQAAL